MILHVTYLEKTYYLLHDWHIVNVKVSFIYANIFYFSSTYFSWQESDENINGENYLIQSIDDFDI